MGESKGVKRKGHSIIKIYQSLSDIFWVSRKIKLPGFSNNSVIIGIKIHCPLVSGGLKLALIRKAIDNQIIDALNVRIAKGTSRLISSFLLKFIANS
jgi:hypothetical protein